MSKIDDLISDKQNQIMEIKKAIQDMESIKAPVEPEKVAEPVAPELVKPVDSEDMLSQQYTSSAREMLKSNPEKAMELFAKAEQIRQQKASKTSPAAIRQQLRMARDAAYRAANDSTLEKSVRDRARQEFTILTAEMAKDVPSDIAAYDAIDALYQGDKPMPSVVTPVTPGVSPAPTGADTSLSGLTASINATLGSIPSKGKSLDSAITKLNDMVNNSGLDKSEKSTLLSKIKTDSEMKKAPAGAPDPDKAVDSLVRDSSTQPVPAALLLYTKAKNAYDSATSALKTKAIGAAIANFLYALRPEAVNEGDIELAKTAVRDNDTQKLKAIVSKFGFGDMFTSDYTGIAKNLGEAAYDKLLKSRKNNVDQIVNLLGKFDPKAVRNRASIYYVLPDPVSGSVNVQPGQAKADPLGIL